VGDLRPRQTYVTAADELVLIVDDPDLSELTGTWKITARGHHAVYEGVLTVPVVAGDLTEVMRRSVEPAPPGRPGPNGG
jgi:hypothetical protein